MRALKHAGFLLGAWLALVAAAWADGLPRAAPPLVFATPLQGRALLTRHDDFVERLSAFDRQARLQHGEPVDTQTYLAFVAASVQAWPAEARQAVQDAYAALRPALDALALPWPAQITLVHTDGSEEAGAAYTRGDAIVLPPSVLAPAAREALPRTLAHELFHVLSRDNPQLRDRAYAAIGFASCAELPLPAPLRDRRITNPDAPRNDHCIAVDVGGTKRQVAPVLYARAPYDASTRKPFFDYLELRLQARDAKVGNGAADGSSQADLLPLADAKGFFEQVGRNTGYVIHPEEILADNFALLVLGTREVRSADVLERIAAALRAPAR